MRKEIIILLLLAAIVIIAAVLGSGYYRDSFQSESKASNIANEALVRDDSPTMGPADAKVTIVEFLDPECESCSSFNPILKRTMKEYEGKVRLVVRYMPLHPNSTLAANFTEAAGEQGKYWEAQTMLFERQPEWGERHGAPASAPKPDVKALFDKYAVDLGLDVEKISSAIRENRYAEKMERDKRDGQSLGVRQTPTFFVNGRQLARLHGAELRALIDDELKK